MVLNLSLRTKHDVNAEAEIARDIDGGVAIMHCKDNCQTSPSRRLTPKRVKNNGVKVSH